MKLLYYISNVLLVAACLFIASSITLLCMSYETYKLIIADFLLAGGLSAIITKGILTILSNYGNTVDDL